MQVPSSRIKKFVFSQFLNWFAVQTCLLLLRRRPYISHFPFLQRSMLRLGRAEEEQVFMGLKDLRSDEVWKKYSKID